jgi:hypothetical protein
MAAIAKTRKASGEHDTIEYAAQSVYRSPRKPRAAFDRRARSRTDRPRFGRSCLAGSISTVACRCTRLIALQPARAARRQRVRHGTAPAGCGHRRHVDRLWRYPPRGRRRGPRRVKAILRQLSGQSSHPSGAWDFQTLCQNGSRKSYSISSLARACNVKGTVVPGARTLRHAPRGRPEGGRAVAATRQLAALSLGRL